MLLTSIFNPIGFVECTWYKLKSGVSCPLLITIPLLPWGYLSLTCPSVVSRCPATHTMSHQLPRHQATVGRNTTVVRRGCLRHKCIGQRRLEWPLWPVANTHRPWSSWFRVSWKASTDSRRGTIGSVNRNRRGNEPEITVYKSKLRYDIDTTLAKKGDNQLI